MGQSGLRFQHFAVLLDAAGAPWVLGRGAGGVTYKAVDTELERIVALKVLSSDTLESDEAKNRFRAEARAAAALRHPNLAAIQHFGAQDGVCFYAMEFIEGKNLEEYVREHGPLPADTALTLAAQAASALGAAHQAGLVHRDVKPANLLLQDAGQGAAQVKLIDFGLATAASPGSTSARSVRFSGTLLYSSPEQLDNHAVDPRSDLYSLGATIFYLLTGHPPFNGSLSQLVIEHTMAPAPVHIIPGSPTAAAVVERLMAKNPQDRPASGTEACVEIEAARAQIRSPERCTAAEWLTTHFAVLRRTAEIEGGAAYRATRHPGEVETPVLFFDRTAEGCALADRFRAAAACLRRLTLPCIRQIENIVEVSDGVLMVHERPVEAARLLSVMRTRRALPVREALVLLQPLAAALDEAASAGLSLPHLGLRDVRLAPAHPSAMPLDKWAGLQPLVDLLPLGPAQGHDAAATVVGTSLGNHAESDTDEELQPGQVIASLAYEMIGGMSAPGGTHFVPLAELSAETNSFLRDVFANPAGASSAGEIVERLQHDAKVSPAEEQLTSRAAAPGHSGNRWRPMHRGPATVERTASQTAHGSSGSRSRARAWVEITLLVIAVAVVVYGAATGWAPLPNRGAPYAIAGAPKAGPTLDATGNNSGGTIATGIGSSSSLSAGLAGLPETNTTAPATPGPAAVAPETAATTATTPSSRPVAGGDPVTSSGCRKMRRTRQATLFR
jgi:tRNA A-37 threonylcarbamoyl transferase component Bud32